MALNAYIINDKPSWARTSEMSKGILSVLTNARHFPQVQWQNYNNEKNVTAKYCGMISEIRDKEVTVLFENEDENIKEAYSFNKSMFDFDIKINDFVILKKMNYDGKISFEFSEYKESLEDKINDMRLAKKLLDEEENYDI